LSNERIIAVGDIHGCHQEFAELLKLLELQEGDRLILLGDLVNRGPDSNAVIDLAKKHNAISLLGNHELRLLQYHVDPKQFDLRNGDTETFEKLRPADWDYFATMPLTWFDKDLNIVFVHGGFMPDEPWQKQPAEIITRIQVVEDGKPRKRSDAPDAPLWADLWNGPPFVVYGHTPRDEVYKLKWSLCLDTGCVLGGALTAYILPEKRLVQVKARKRYVS
jgi:serine/threonine protein phosphatase 1